MRKTKYAEKKQAFTRAQAIAAIFIALLVLPLAGAMFQSLGHVASDMITLTTVGDIPVLPSGWLQFATVVVLTVCIVAAVVYQLGAVVQSPNARAWARIQVYEAILSLLLLIIVAGLIVLVTTNPLQTFETISLVGTSSPYSCTSAQDLFQLSACDLAVFNTFAFGIFESLFYVTFVSGMNTGIRVSAVFIPEPDGNLQYTAQAGISSLLPIGIVEGLSSMFMAIGGLLLLNQVQLLIISGSLLWLSFFVTVGIIARTFGFSRTFGGAMIALGLGLGIIFPLMVSLTYGYINYQLSTTTACAATGCAAGVFGADLLAAVSQVVLGGGLPTGGWIYPLGVAIAGLTFIPFLNFTIVDAFIVDFSRAMGERLDFMSLLAGVI